MPAYDKIIGRNIRNARKEKGMTQADMAEALGVSTAYVGKLERAERSINLDKLTALVPILDVSIDQMVLGCVPWDYKPKDKDDFMSAVSEIVKGCSPEAKKTMLDVLAAIAKNDKLNA